MKEAKSLPEGKARNKAAAEVIMDYYNPFLVALIPLADAKDPEHEHIIRRLLHSYCYYVYGSKWMHHSLDAFQGGGYTYRGFLAYAKEHIDEIFPKRIEVYGIWLTDPGFPFDRRKLLG